MHQGEPIVLSRDCDAVLIPDGSPVTLQENSIVYITQALGGSYTVNINGNLARIAAHDIDALGFEIEEDNNTLADKPIVGDGTVDEEVIWQQLGTCYDPEIPINIVELGLIYECVVTPLEEKGNRVDIVMTLTAPGCGMGEFLTEDVQSKVGSVPNVTEVNVDLTFEPPWDQTMMSDVARLETGLY